jgi:hypothetical protein
VEHRGRMYVWWIEKLRRVCSFDHGPEAEGAASGLAPEPPRARAPPPAPGRPPQFPIGLPEAQAQRPGSASSVARCPGPASSAVPPVPSTSARERGFCPAAGSPPPSVLVQFGTVRWALAPPASQYRPSRVSRTVLISFVIQE